jgi:hypothetical protein
MPTIKRALIRLDPLRRPSAQSRAAGQRRPHPSGASGYGHAGAGFPWIAGTS